MKLIGKLALFAAILLLVTQLACVAAPTTLVYNHRLKYAVFKDNVNTLEPAIWKLSRQIRREGLKDYVVLLGDSVLFSTPVDEYASMGPLLEKAARADGYATRVFNLALPSEYPGDIHAILQLLDRYGISRDHVVINFNYFEFVADASATGVFWLRHQLRDVDPASYEKVYRSAVPTPPAEAVKKGIAHWLDRRVWVFPMKDYLRNRLMAATVPGYRDTLGDTRPWFEKETLPEELQKKENRWYFSDKPMVLDESRAAVHHVNHIADLQAGKGTLVLLPAYNRDLLPKETSSPGYIDNRKRLLAYLSGKPFDVLDLDGRIDCRLHADFVHFTPEGYKELAGIVWERIKPTLPTP